ncbi:MAG: 2-amino-4-hydroxy-6-hydroxymethyldihydropteridine diphosphokinase [Erythrobacter sp.]
MSQHYLIALGSNMRVSGVGGPKQVLSAACAAMEESGLDIEAVSPFITSAPIGPSLRRYSNAAAVIACDAGPPELLVILQSIEREFGRVRSQRMGQRWRARALDLDIVLWSGGAWSAPALTIPHRELRRRDFVLGPACAIAGDWKDPLSGLTVQQLRARLKRA